MSMKDKVLWVLRWKEERQSRKKLCSQPFWPSIRDRLQGVKFLGCSFMDYWFLYHIVRRLKPKEVLECGTGISTWFLAAALVQNEKEGDEHGRLTSMEDREEWYKTAVELLPVEFRSTVEIVYSPKSEYTWSIFRGVGYKEVPERAYTLVFVDGPEDSAPSDGAKSFDFDYINVVRRSEVPVLGIIDGRLSTCYVLQKVFGTKKVKYDLVRDTALVGPCSKVDLVPFRASSSEAFSHSRRIFGLTRFDIQIEREQSLS